MPETETISSPTQSIAAVSGGLGDRRARFYRPELDLVRFLAFLSVFLNHNLSVERSTVATRFPSLNQWWPALGGSFSFGLGLFFCLSAYLICELLLREKHKMGRIDLKAFYVRRILRIWPLYFFGIAVGMAFALFTHYIPDLWRYTAFLVLAGNWYCTIFGWTTNPMFLLWSISIEEQFYLVWPWLTRSLRQRHLVLISLLFILISNVTLFVMGSNHADVDHVVWCNSFAQLEMFAAGLLICLLLRGSAPRIPAVLRLVLIASGPASWFIAVYFFHVRGRHPADGAITLVAGYGIAAIGCAAILIGFLGISPKLVPGWVLYLGKISFGLYVFNIPAMQIVESLLHGRGIGSILLSKALILGLTVLMAAISFRFLETPFLRLKHRFELVPSRPV